MARQLTDAQMREALTAERARHQAEIARIDAGAARLLDQSWRQIAEVPPEGTFCAVLLETKDIVLAFACSAWKSGFFVTRALRPLRGVARRKLEALPSKPVLWRAFGEFPPAESVLGSGLVNKEIRRREAEECPPTP